VQEVIIQIQGQVDVFKESISYVCVAGEEWIVWVWWVGFFIDYAGDHVGYFSDGGHVVLILTWWRYKVISADSTS